MSVYSMMFMGMAPIGSLLAGAVAARRRAHHGSGGRRHLHGGAGAFALAAAHPGSAQADRGAADGGRRPAAGSDRRGARAGTGE